MTMIHKPIASAPVRTAALDIVLMTAADLSCAIRSRQVSCREVMTAYLDHIERLNPHVNAIVSLQRGDDLLVQAAKRDEELARGLYRGWLHGFPQAVKDIAQTEGVPSTRGSLLFKDHVPQSDTPFVRRMRDAGAIVIGKTNTPEFGLGSHTTNAVFGTTLNSYNPTWTAGGSSGGAAVALALHMLPVADGSDHAGSLRNPAAFNNVLGFRPTSDSLPSEGRERFVPTLGVVGPMARSVRDLFALLKILADPHRPMSEADRVAISLDGPRDEFCVRLGWLGNCDGYLPFEAGVIDLCERALKDFIAIGCCIEPVRLPYPLEHLWQTWATLRAWQVGGALKQHARDNAQHALMQSAAIYEIEIGSRLTAYDIYDASVSRSAFRRAFLRLFETCDFLLLPSAQVFPFEAGLQGPAAIAGRTMDTYHRWMEVAILATMAGSPVVNVPAGFSDIGKPMGLQIIGPPGRDLACLQLARMYETATGWVERRPPLLTDYVS